MNNYGKAIFSLRKKHNLTQEQLGKKINVTYQAVSKWENNLAQPDLEMVEKLTKIFGITMSEFFDMAKCDDNLDNLQTDILKNEDKYKKLYIGNSNHSLDIKKIVYSPWFIVSVLSVFVLLFGLIALLVSTRYNKEQVYAKTSDAIFCANINNGNNSSSGFFIDSSGVAVIMKSNPTQITKGTINFKKGEKKYNIVSVLGYDTESNFVIVKVDINNAPCLKLSSGNKVHIADKVYVMNFDSNNEVTIIECLVSQVNFTDNKNKFDLVANTKSGSIIFDDKAQIIGITKSINNIGMMSAMPIDYVNDIKRDNQIDLEIDVANSVNQYVIRFDANGASGTMHDQACNINQSYNLSSNQFVKVGYTFVGWSNNSENFNDEQEVKNLTTIGSTFVMKAEWQPITYKIKFCYGEQEPYYQSLFYDQQVKLLSCSFIFDHANFDYWSCDDGRTFADQSLVCNLTTIPDDIIVMTAITKNFTYKIKYVKQKNGSTSLDNVITYNYFQSYDVRTVDYETGYVFKYWIDENGNKYNSDASLGYISTFSKLCEYDGETITFTGIYDLAYYNVYIKNSVTQETYSLGSKSYFEKFCLPDCPFVVEFGYELVKYQIREIAYPNSNPIATSKYFNIGQELNGASINDGFRVYDNQDFVFWTVFDTVKLQINYYYGVNSKWIQYKSLTYEYGQDNEIESAQISMGDYDIGDYWIDEQENKYKNINDEDSDGFITIINKIYAGVKETINLYLVTKTKTCNITFVNSLTNEKIYVGEKSYLDAYNLPECPFEIPDGYEFDCYNIKLYDFGECLLNKYYYQGDNIIDLIVNRRLTNLFITVKFKNV